MSWTRLSVFFILGFVLAAHPLQAQNVKSDQDVLIELERQWDAAFHSQNAAFIDTVLADEFIATYGDGSRGDKSEGTGAGARIQSAGRFVTARRLHRQGLPRHGRRVVHAVPGRTREGKADGGAVPVHGCLGDSRRALAGSCESEHAAGQQAVDGARPRLDRRVSCQMRGLDDRWCPLRSHQSRRARLAAAGSLLSGCVRLRRGAARAQSLRRRDGSRDRCASAHACKACIFVFRARQPTGPTLEIFTYSDLAEDLPRVANRPGFAHIAFAVDSVTGAREEVLSHGGTSVGDVVTVNVSTTAQVTWCYVRDPEGNIIELQAWSAGGFAGISRAAEPLASSAQRLDAATS